MAITITITDPQDHAPYELQVLAQYFQALANDKRVAKPAPPTLITTHDEELLSDEERAALRGHFKPSEDEMKKAFNLGVDQAWLEDAHNPYDPKDLQQKYLWEAYEEGMSDVLSRPDREAIRASAGGDQEPYAVNAGGSDDFAELRNDPKSDASTPADASDGKTAPAGLDSSGLPWDERIHSSSKAQNADGTWRYKRGGDLDERKRVEAELRGIPQDLKGLQGGSGDFDPADLPTVEDDVPPPPPADDDIPRPPVDDAEDLPPPPPVEEEPVDMGKVFRAITEGQKAGLTQDKLAACLKDVGLTATQDIIGKPVEILAPLLKLIKEASV